MTSHLLVGDTVTQSRRSTSGGKQATLHDRPLLLLMDGHAIVHRAWAAIRQPLTIRTTGEEVQGVYGFMNAFLKALSDWQPSHCAIAFDTSIELSFTQKWVLAIDLVYTYQNHSTFSGHKGRTAAGTTASVGAPSNDNLSCAPAIEYNPADNIGFLAGVWFAITGRNSSDFVAGVLSMYYYW